MASGPNILRSRSILASTVFLAVGAGAAEAATSCAQAEAKVRRQGYAVSSKTCGGPVHTFSAMKGEAVLIKVDARTGRVKKILGGD